MPPKIRVSPLGEDDLPEHFSEGYKAFYVEGFPEGFFEGNSAPLSQDEGFSGGHVFNDKTLKRLVAQGIVPSDEHLYSALRLDGFHLLEHTGHSSTWAVPDHLVPFFPKVMHALSEGAEIPPHVREALHHHYKGDVEDWHDTLSEHLPKLARNLPAIFKAPTSGYAYRFVTSISRSGMAQLFDYEPDHFAGRKGVIVGGMYEPAGTVTSWSTSLQAVLGFAKQVRGGKRTTGSRNYYDVLLVASLSQDGEGFYLNPNKAPYVCGADRLTVDIPSQREVVSLGPVQLVKSVWQRMGQYEDSEEPMGGDSRELPRTPVSRLKSLLKPRRAVTPAP